MIRFGLPLGLSPDFEGDELTKAFTSGPKASHKYWRRVRVMQGGKLTWRYYYNTPEDRARYKEDRKKRKRKGKKAKHKHEDDSHLTDSEIENLHTSRDDWFVHFAETRTERTRLAGLTANDIFERAGMKAAKVTFDDAANAMAHAYVEADSEPDDLWAQAIHPLRALETAVGLLPDEIRTTMDGALKDVRFFGTKKAGSQWTVKETPAKKRPSRKSSAWACPKIGTIVIPMDTTRMMEGRPWSSDDMTINGGARPVKTMLHEMAHIFAYQMQSEEWQNKHKSAPNWDDWKSIKAFRGRNKEPGITDYAEKNIEERFCESFAAALMTPYQLWESCPEAYAFMHRMMPSKVPAPATMVQSPLREMDLNDFANPFWLPPKGADTIVGSQISLAESQYRARSDFYRHNPPDADKAGPQDGGKADRFFEMSFRGRKLFFRYGMENAEDLDSSGNLATKWEPSTPTKAAPAQHFAKISQLKEVYDENGNPVPPHLGYLHLIQDVLKDDTTFAVVAPTVGKGKSKRKLKPKEITMMYVEENGGFDSDDPYIAALFDKSGGRLMLHKVLRAFGKAGITKDLKELDKLHAAQRGLSPTSAAYRDLSAQIAAIESRVETDADLSGHTVRKMGNSMLPTPASMSPAEISHNDFRQRSGTFNYDNFEIEGQEWIERINRTKAGSLEEMKILDEMKSKFPGMLELKMRRWPKGATQVIDGKVVKVGGRFREGAPFVVKDPRTGKRVPALRKVTYVMDNPDGTKTKIPVQKGSDGRYRIRNTMWRKLLTPNDEDVRSAEHLAELCRVAAANKHRGWVSVATDRPRRRDERGRWTVDPKGDSRRHLHMEVEFDGKGPPRLLGRAWEKKLGTDNPRIDQLLKDDPLGEKLKWAKGRRIIPADQINMVTPPKKTGPPTTIGDRVVLTTRTLDWQGTTDRGGRKVVARLVKYMPAKAAGEPPPEPGWDRMPEGIPDLTLESPPGLAGKISPKMKDLISRGLLPPWYKHTPKQRDWYLNHYVPAHKSWKDTFEAEKAKAYDAVYVFAGEINMGGGSKTFTRVGTDVMESIEHADEAPAPEALDHEPLAYLHKFIDPRTGEVMGSEQRILLPKDGSITPAVFDDIPGVILHEEVIGKDDRGREITQPSHMTFSLESFAQLRDRVRVLSHTDDIGTLLQQRVAMLKAAERQRQDESHALTLDQLDPTWMADNWDAGLNRTLPNGARFTLADHQKRGLQKLFDNDLRVLLAHFMGTGKTVSALSACKMAMARPMRQGLSHGEKIPDDLIGDERQKWLDDHPFVPGTLDPRNPKRCLVVAPLNTVEQWRQSASDFDEGAVVVGAGSNDIPIDDFVAGIKDGTIDTDLVVVGPQYFTQHAAKLKECGFDGLVIDEVHQGIKNESAERNKVVNDWNPDMKMMMLLTGTPMTTSPADFVEYIRILSNDAQFSGMTKKLFTEEYLMKTPLPEQMGVKASAPKIQIRPEKLAEFGAILAQWMDIALPKQVKGKVLPAVYIDASETAQMSGAQIAAYNLYMAVLNAHGEGTGGVSAEELGKLSADARQSAVNAKGVSNCVGYKPASDDADAMVVMRTVDKKGKVSTGKRVFYAPDPRVLFSKQQRGKNAGRWPYVEELQGGEQGAAVLDEYAAEILGQPYSELAGKPIGWGIEVPGVEDPFKIPPTAAQTREARKRMEKAGWVGGTKKFANRDVGHVGLRFRGRSIAWDKALQKKIDAARRRGDTKEVAMLQNMLRKKGERIAEAQQFQRDYRHAMQYGIGEITPKKLRQTHPDDVLAEVARDHEISVEQARELLSVSPNQATIEDRVTYKSDFGEVTITTDDQYTSDPSGSNHLLYRQEDVDAQGKPKTGGKAFSEIKPNETIVVDLAALKKAVDENGKPAPVMKKPPPKGATREQKAEWKKRNADWAPPVMRLGSGETDEKGRVAVYRDDTGEKIFVPQKSISSIVVSLMHPGRREDRFKADVMMTEGNAKTDMVQRHIENFHDGSGDGPDGPRQMVLFANEILTGCRTLEAKLRQMGYRDVNEVIEGSPLHDPADPSTKGGVGPNRKYFVTYIGSTFTGDREQNCLIFKKVKDSLGRDSKTSLFVDMNLRPRSATKVKVSSRNPDTGKMEKMTVPVDWMTYRGDTGVEHVPAGVERLQMSQLSSAQRETARRTLGINPPECFVSRMNGKVMEQAYFYGATIPPKVKKRLLEQFSAKDAKGRYKDKLVRSEDILTVIARTPDPSKQTDPAKAKAFADKIAALKAAYSEIAAANATTDPPLDGKQIEVFNNCDFVVASDAAQVGINWGNSSEMIMYDSLGSPMAEWQRMTRCARLLPEAVSKDLFGTPVMEPVMVPKRYKTTGEIVMKQGKPVMTKKMVAALDDDGNPTGKKVPAMVQKRDEYGQFVYAGDGVVDAIRKAEREIFQTENRAVPQGTVRGLRLNFPIDPEHASGDKPRAKETVNSALEAIAERAELRSSIAENPRMAKAWASIANQALTARNQGGEVARSQLLKFKETGVPGGTGNLIDFPATGLPKIDLMAGTYDRVDTKSAEQAVRRAIEKMDDKQRQKIMDAGFVKPADPPHPATPDAASLYVAMRAQEVLTWMDVQQPVIAAEMRDQAGGATVTDEDVMNRMVQMLTPEDRAILKERKYLVNVRKIKASGAVGQVVKHRIGRGDDAFTYDVHTGYEQEYPVKTEQRTESLGRARTVSNEQIMTEVMAGVDFKTDVDFDSIRASELTAAAEIVKSLRLVFNMETLGRPSFNPLDLIRR